MALIRHIMEYLVNPLFICLLTLGIALIFLWHQKTSMSLRVMLAIVFIVLLMMSTGWLPRYLTYRLESQYSVISQLEPDIQWVVVLSGGQNVHADMPANNLLASASIKRLIEGLRLLRQLPKAKLLLSGGGSAGEQPEALLMAQLAKWFAIPDHRVILELQSINTADQARALGAIVHEQPFYLVTSAAHMPRSMALCQQQGLKPIAAPTDFTFFWTSDKWVKLFIPNTYNMSYFSISLHEYLGRLWARV